MISMGTGPTPINIFQPLDTVPLEFGKSVNLDKFFDYKENLAAVALKNGQLVYERYDKKGGFADKFPAHGMSMTKTAVGLVIGICFATGKFNHLMIPWESIRPIWPNRYIAKSRLKTCCAWQAG